MGECAAGTPTVATSIASNSEWIAGAVDCLLNDVCSADHVVWVSNGSTHRYSAPAAAAAAAMPAERRNDATKIAMVVMLFAFVAIGGFAAVYTQRGLPVADNRVAVVHGCMRL